MYTCNQSKAAAPTNATDRTVSRRRSLLRPSLRRKETDDDNETDNLVNKLINQTNTCFNLLCFVDCCCYRFVCP